MKYKPSRQEVNRFLKYIAGGSVYFVIGYGFFAFGYSVLHWWWLWAKLLGDVLGWSINYLIQRFWTFSDHVHLSEMQHAGRYIFIEAFGFVLDYAIVGVLKHLGITPYIGIFISAAFFTVWSYLWYKYWVFPKKRPKIRRRSSAR